MIAKSLRQKAERAAEWALREIFRCVETRRCLRTKFAKVDFFGTDVVGIDPSGMKYWIQVTTGGDEAIRQRRRKLEAVPWRKTSDVVEVWRMKESGTQGRRKAWVFVRHSFCVPTRLWKSGNNQIPITTEWFKAYREKEDCKHECHTEV